MDSLPVSGSRERVDADGRFQISRGGVLDGQSKNVQKY